MKGPWGYAIESRKFARKFLHPLFCPDVVFSRCQRRGFPGRVRAFIAHTSRTGAERLRQLEMRFLAAGVTVARTSDDLDRYHAKFMIVDRQTLYVLAFNLTYRDLQHSRSFGVVARNRKLVQE